MPAESVTELRAAIGALATRVERLESAARSGKPRHVEPAAIEATRAAGEVAALESRLGGYWTARLGIVCLVTGVAFFVAHGFAHVGPGLKAACGYALAGALAWLGRRVMRGTPGLGRILVSGGLGVGYYTTYAICHVPSVQLIASPEIGFVLLAAAVLGIIAVAQRMGSETVAGLALFLGLHTGMVSEVGVFTLASGCLLAGGAGYFMAKNRWVIVPLSTLIAVYSTLITWLLGNPLTTEAQVVHPPDHLGTALAFAGLYYLTFAIAVGLAPRQLPRLAGAGFALLNWAGAALVSVYELSYHRAGHLEAVFAILAVSSLALAAAAARRCGRQLSFHLHLALAAASVALAAWSALDGAPLILSLCGLAAVAAALARALESAPLRAASAAIAGVAFLAQLAGGTDDPGLALAVIAALIALERLAPSGDRVDRLGRLAPVCGVAVVAAASAAVLAPPAVVTAVWIAAAAALFALGLALEAIHYRLVGLGVAGVASVRLFLHDLAALGAGARIASFLAAGALLLGVSFVYSRRRAAG